MTKLAVIRGVLCAVACLLGGLLLPHAATATTVNAYSSLTLGFDIGPLNDALVNVEFTGLDGVLGVQLAGGFTGSADVLSNGDVNFTGVTGPGSEFLITVANNAESAVHFSDVRANGIEDAVLVTPIPTSLPLFLTGAILLAGFMLRRRLGRVSEQLAI